MIAQGTFARSFTQNATSDQALSLTLNILKGKVTVQIINPGHWAPPACVGEVAICSGSPIIFNTHNIKLIDISADSKGRYKAYLTTLDIHLSTVSDLKLKGKPSGCYNSCQTQTGTPQPTLFIVDPNRVTLYSYSSPQKVNRKFMAHRISLKT